MKSFFFVSFLFLLCCNFADAQTNANLAGPENVLVVYKHPIDQNDSLGLVSQAVKNYYQNARGIPESNIVPLNSLVSQNINVDGSTHNVTIAEGGNIIRDTVNHNNTWFATRHAWKYFYENVAAPIKEHISTNNLTDIRYIVLCKGVPFYIQAACDSTNVIANLAVDGLLSMLGTNNYENLLNSIYTKYRSYAIDGDDYYYGSQRQISNPYYNADPNLEMNNRFKPGIFTKTWNGHTIKLDYLVSHLDGISYNMVKDMIDLSSEAIHADNYDWFIDADPAPCHGGSIMVNFANSTASKLNSMGFSNYSFNTNEDTVTYHNKPVMSYSSNGVHTTKPPSLTEGGTLHPDYIQSQLNFDYVPGAIFNTAESFNAWRLSSVTRASTPMGQVVEFFQEGGTVAVGHANEPFTDGVVIDNIMLPSYQAGYSFIDAAYMGMNYLAWQNVVIGDPLTTIAWGKQTLTANTTLSGTNLVTGKITVPAGKTLTIASNAVINFKHTGSLEINGTLTIQPGASLNFYNGNSLVVNSVINANGNSTDSITFDFISQNSTTENGIILNENSSGRISYSKIKNAYRGIKVDQGIPSSQTDPFVEYCEIFDCYDGLYLYQSNYELTMFTGTKIWHNEIHDNDHSGINLLDSAPQIAGNEIYNNPEGIRCITGSHAVFGELGDPGANNIYDNGTSIYSNYSSPYIGRDDPFMFFGGYNTIAGDDYHLHAENGGYIYAELNYWGADSTKIVAGSGSVIDYRPYLSFASIIAGPNVETPNSLSKGSSTNNTELNPPEELTEAMKLFLNQEYKSAWDICKSILAESSVSTNETSELTFISALYLIEKFKSKIDKQSLETSLSAYSNYSEKKNVFGYAEIILAELSNDNYLQKMDNIISEYNGSITELAAFKKFVYSYFDIKNVDNAKSVYDDMVRLFPSSELTKEAAAILGKSVNQIEKKDAPSSVQVSKELTASNYPNPFNPSTIISYSLPEKNHVTIKIFDILGREITELVNEVKEEGTHSVNFDASYLSSGFYIYTLSTSKNSISKKMLLLK